MVREQLRKKIEYSINLLKKSEKVALRYSPEGFYVAFSGGKDSQCIYHLCKMAGVKFTAHMSLTSVDPPQVIRFVKQNYPDVEMIKPKDSIYHLAYKQRTLPTQLMRWCCKILKEQEGGGRVVVIGIRHAEGVKRSKRSEIEVSGRKFAGNFEEFTEFQKREAFAKMPKDTNYDTFSIDEETSVKCISGKDSIMVSPVIHWSDRDVWEFLNDVAQVPHCSLYDEGLHRIGCINCPMSQPRQKRMENERWPHVKRNWLIAIEKMQKELGLYSKKGFETPENVYDWWVSGKSYEMWYADRFLQTEIQFE